MSNPDEEATQKTFEEKVTEAVKNSSTEGGKLVFEEGTPEEVVYAATLEKRRRDTQASFTGAKQDNAVLKAENNELIKQASTDVAVELSEEQEEELEDLKFSDPEKWRRKVNAYETEAKQQHAKKLEENLKEVSEKGIKTAELERRKQVLEDFIGRNPGFELNDEILANDIPPRITNKLAKSKISFEEYLDEVVTYMKANKKVASEGVDGEIDLGKAAGSDTPTQEAVKIADAESYENTVF